MTSLRQVGVPLDAPLFGFRIRPGTDNRYLSTRPARHSAEGTDIAQHARDVGTQLVGLALCPLPVAIDTAVDDGVHGVVRLCVRPAA
jgi:hypothetical protein